MSATHDLHDFVGWRCNLMVLSVVLDSSLVPYKRQLLWNFLLGRGFSILRHWARAARQAGTSSLWRTLSLGVFLVLSLQQATSWYTLLNRTSTYYFRSFLPLSFIRIHLCFGGFSFLWCFLLGRNFLVKIPQINIWNNSNVLKLYILALAYYYFQICQAFWLNIYPFRFNQFCLFTANCRQKFVVIKIRQTVHAFIDNRAR